MPQDSYYKFRVRNQLFGSNSSKAQKAAKDAASQVGASIAKMDDSDTSVSGWSGFFLKVTLNKEVDHADFINKFKPACERHGLGWGTSASICEDNEDWRKGHAGVAVTAKFNEVTSEAMKLQQGFTNFVVEAGNYISGKESAVIVVSASVDDYQTMQPYTLRLKAAGYTIYQYNDTNMTRDPSVPWQDQWFNAANMSWKVLCFKTSAWEAKKAEGGPCAKEWAHIENFGKRLRVCSNTAELGVFVSNLEGKKVESWYQDKWSSTRLT